MTEAPPVVARPRPVTVVAKPRSSGLGRLELAEYAGLAVSTPLLLFPNRFSLLALVLLPALWLARLIAGEVRSHKVADIALTGMLLMTCVSLYPSVDLNLSRPKLYGLILGFYVFTLTLQYASTPRRRELLVRGLAAAGVLVSLVGLVAVRWNSAKFAFLDPIYRRLPHLITRIQTSFGGQDGIHPNEVGGVLALLLPIAAALVLFSSFRRDRLLALAAVALMGGTLVLTGSRSGWEGVALAFGLLALLRWPRLVWATPVAAAGIAVAVLKIGPDRVAETFVALDAASGSSALGRLEVWSRAVDMIRDFPFTGIGLNTFPIVLNALYPLFSVDPAAANLPHAHNLFLQTAVDLGVLGLLSFVALWAVAGVQLFRGWRCHAADRVTVTGLSGGLLAHFVYSQTDAVALGAKPGVILWAVLGGTICLGAATPYSTSAWKWAQLLLLVVACGTGIGIAVSGVKMLPM